MSQNHTLKCLNIAIYSHERVRISSVTETFYTLFFYLWRCTISKFQAHVTMSFTMKTRIS